MGRKRNNSLIQKYIQPEQGINPTTEVFNHRIQLALNEISDKRHVISRHNLNLKHACIWSTVTPEPSYTLVTVNQLTKYTEDSTTNTETRYITGFIKKNAQVEYGDFEKKHN